MFGAILGEVNTPQLSFMLIFINTSRLPVFTSGFGSLVVS
jgi:hypothetical protein